MTIQCVPDTQLQQKTFVLGRKEIKNKGSMITRHHRHARIMWIPYTDTVVIEHSDPIEHTGNVTFKEDENRPVLYNFF